MFHFGFRYSKIGSWKKTHHRKIEKGERKDTNGTPKLINRKNKKDNTMAKNE